MTAYKESETDSKTDNQAKVLKQLWDAEQNILDIIDDFCKRNNLCYSLAYGTLLGAMRHQGFIPWDDDVDIMMPREDYERFKSLWKKDPPKGYVLQDEDTEEGYVNNFMKIRKDHTTFLQFDMERSRPIHKGIFVDVFPGDRIAPGFFTKKLQLFDFAMCLLYNRGYTSGKRGAFAFFEKLLLTIVPKGKHRRLSNWFGNRSRRWNKLKQNELVFPSTIRVCRVFYPANLFSNIQRICFRGKHYNAVEKADAYLQTMYGDYMKLPPEDERVWKHHPIILDFNRNYEELTEEERWPKNTVE